MTYQPHLQSHEVPVEYLYTAVSYKKLKNVSGQIDPNRTAGLNKKMKSGKMTNPSTLINELVVLPDCHLLLMHLTGTPLKNENLIRKRRKKINENCVS
ncbi:hypothetical protein AVEN_161149-1 [Araneus ventricosus]|uniref:Uncharacterized protein n=1 Tax=Araneus ventricosus TaxID=182803 RepID=A0A4Y2NQX9_ARAVE|nr:hypothetical protein AVEN_161149-1 [Araneus ventricosus]